MKYLVTGVTGFIGFSIVKKLLKNPNSKIFGIDNINNYYDINLKKKRLGILKKSKNFFFKKIDINNKNLLQKHIRIISPNIIFHLAAQAGVRYSKINPDEYIQSNIIGTYNVLEASKQIKIKHIIIASSSSVYGVKSKIYSETTNTDMPLNIYAATKKTNEIIAYPYSYLYKKKIIIVRFFTVYGPWGRPDMALYSFAKNIIKNKAIEIFNKGKLSRDFTYIDDITDALIKLKDKTPIKDHNKSYYQIINLGNSKQEKLMKFIKLIENNLSKVANKKFIEHQSGDMYFTKADIKKAKKLINYNPRVNINEGIPKFIKWFKDYSKI